MVQIIFGVVLTLIGVLLLVRGIQRGQNESARRQEGFIGRFGTLMMGVVLAFLGVALLLPAREATPTSGANTNPVDETIEEGGEETGD